MPATTTSPASLPSSSSTSGTVSGLASGLASGSSSAVPAGPVLKWVGGKKRMLPEVLPHYGGQPRVVEPFFGGGAVSFELAARHAGLEVVANDQLADVIAIYEAVRGDVEGFIQGVEAYASVYLAHTEKAKRRTYYYNVRQQYMERKLDGPEVLFFMLWCAYSGMFRTGKEYPGRFNTSHGFGVERAGFYHPDRLRSSASLMQGWEFSSGDFAATLKSVDAETFVFLDPPYRETYDGYTDEGFSEADQLRVVEYFHDCHRRGAKVVYTNKDTGDDFYTTNFAGFSIKRVPIKYSVNRNAPTVGRPVSHEVVISN